MDVHQFTHFFYSHLVDEGQHECRDEVTRLCSNDRGSKQCSITRAYVCVEIEGYKEDLS